MYICSLFSALATFSGAARISKIGSLSRVGVMIDVGVHFTLNPFNVVSFRSDDEVDVFERDTVTDMPHDSIRSELRGDRTVVLSTLANLCKMFGSFFYSPLGSFEFRHRQGV